MDSSNKNNKDNKKAIISNHTPRGSAIFLDEEAKNVPIELSILKLEMKKRELLEKYYETDYYKSGKDKKISNDEMKKGATCAPFFVI